VLRLKAGDDDDRALGELPGEDHDPWWFMPTPQVAAVAVMAMLTAGVVIGSVTSPVARSYGVAPIVVEELAGAEPEVEPGPETASAEPSVVPEATAYAATTEAAPAPPAEAPAPPAEAPPPLELPPELEEEAQLPEIKHVFLVVLDGHGYEEAFGEDSEAPYLAKTLTAEGKLLAGYSPEAPGGLGGEVEALPEQLATASLSWKAYVEAPEVEGSEGSPAACPPSPRDPFSYFVPAPEGAECPEAGADEVGLDQLAPDLEEGGATPSLAYIFPNSCHDGAETPCEPERPAGLGAADGFLESVVTQIASSPAYEEEDSLIAVTFDRAPQEGEAVGMLLISPYVAPGTVDETGRYGPLSFLRTVQELFGIEPPADAVEPAVLGFGAAVFDASPEESTVAEEPAQSSRMRIAVSVPSAMPPSASAARVQPGGSGKWPAASTRSTSALRRLP
jgi:Phosphoesterase family